MGLPVIISKGDSLPGDRGDDLRVLRARGSACGHVSPVLQTVEPVWS